MFIVRNKFAQSQTAQPLLVSLLAAFPLLAAAQTTELVAPSAGAILQQIQQNAPPAVPSTGTGLVIEREGSAKLPQSPPFLVETLKISGNTLFETTTLHALVADVEGKSINLSQLDELAARITSYYQRGGYPLARAIIPAQTISSGVVRIEVIEARYSQINLDNRSRVNDPLLQSTLSLLQSGQPISQTELDRTLLLLSDIPGVLINAVLKPGQAVGTSELLVNTTPGPVVTGNMALDNYGNRYTGRPRVGGTVNFINPLRLGDTLSVSGLSSGSGVNYGLITYEFLLNGKGTRVGGSYVSLRYVLGEPLASLNAHGNARVGSLWVKHPLVRSQNFNLYGQIQYDGKQLQDRIDTSNIRTDRQLDNWTLNLAGDALLLGGINSWSLGWTSGRVGFDDRAAQLLDAATAKTQGRFSKWNANFARLQNLGPKNALYFAASGQWANTNLDAVEKLSVGGGSTVRAYDTGAVSGGAGYFATAEYRHALGQGWGGQWQSVAFIDSARVTVNKNTWSASENKASLSGVGLGLNWTGPNQWSAKAYIATPVGSVPVLAGTQKSTRIWLEARKFF